MKAAHVTFYIEPQPATEIEENTKGRVTDPYGIRSPGRDAKVVDRVDPAASVAET